MLDISAPTTSIIPQRFSCRKYHQDPIEARKRKQLRDFIEALPAGPFGTRPRFQLEAATETDSGSLRGLGTYGIIKNPPAFLMSAMRAGTWNIVDFGYLLESIILFATSLNLGTCWLGGTFTRSRFAKKINLTDNETMPAVISIGEYVDPEQKRKGWISTAVGAARRLPWEKLFFNFSMDVPLLQNEAGAYATALEMVRIGPSSSNKQPWRFINHTQFWRVTDNNSIDLVGFQQSL